MNRTLTCTLENRLGALDRMLGTLTHWGFLTESLESRKDPETQYLTVTVNIECDEDKTVEKLVKAIEKQVYVLGVTCFADNKNQVLSLEAKRRDIHVSSNAIG